MDRSFQRSIEPTPSEQHRDQAKASDEALYDQLVSFDPSVSISNPDRVKSREVEDSASEQLLDYDDASASFEPSIPTAVSMREAVEGTGAWPTSSAADHKRKKKSLTKLEKARFDLPHPRMKWKAGMVREEVRKLARSGGRNPVFGNKFR